MVFPGLTSCILFEVRTVLGGQHLRERAIAFSFPESCPHALSGWLAHLGSPGEDSPASGVVVAAGGWKELNALRILK